jgi:Mannosyltransferase (PIG-V)
VDTASEHVEPLPRTSLPPVAPARVRRAPASRRLLDRVWARAPAAVRDARLIIAVYLGTRALLLLLTLVDGLRHHVLPELANWDGAWYRELANRGYPHHVVHGYSTLGFFPGYPLVTWIVARPLLPIMHSSVSAITAAGIIVAGIGGLVAAVLVQRLATEWWGTRIGVRAALLFCLFPGSVVFSMVYAEGLVIPLAAGCILALQHRRWVLAGVLAGLATATEPEALILVLVCAVSAAGELHRRGASDHQARRSLLAPALSLTGLVAVGAFLWSWTGTPFASMIAQRDAWNERTDPLALVHLAQSLGRELSFSHFDHPTINLNLVVGMAGAILLIVLLVLLARCWREVSLEALIWTLGISFLMVTSEYTWPNPRLLITAFPAVVVLARYERGRGFTWLLWVNGTLLTAMSAATFIGTTLRP